MRVWTSRSSSIRMAGILHLLCMLLPIVSNAATCESEIPSDDIVVKYAVYTQSSQMLTGVLVTDGAGKLIEERAPALEIIQPHFQAAQDLFANSGLQLSLVDASRPAPIVLSDSQTQLIKDFLGEADGDPQTRIDSFVENLQQEGIYEDNRLNIYYVEIADLSGVHFRYRDGRSRNLIFVGSGYYSHTLAHEMGHAFSLNHANFWSHDDPDLVNDEGKKIFPNGVRVEYCAEYGYWNNECDFARNNLMWAAQESRDHVTAGQRLRALCNETSSLVTNKDWEPSAPMRCPDWSTEGDCPETFQ